MGLGKSVGGHAAYIGSPTEKDHHMSRDIFPVRLSASEKKRLENLAAANGQSMSALIRLWIMTGHTPATTRAAA